MNLNETEQGQERLRLHSVKEAAQILCVSPWTVYELMDQGRLAGVYQGRRRYVTDAAIKAYVASLSNVPESA